MYVLRRFLINIGTQADGYEFLLRPGTRFSRVVRRYHRGIRTRAKNVDARKVCKHLRNASWINDKGNIDGRIRRCRSVQSSRVHCIFMRVVAKWRTIALRQFRKPSFRNQIIIRFHVHSPTNLFCITASFLRYSEVIA